MLIRKNITFSEEVIEALEPKAKKRGMSVTKYIQFLAIKEADEEIDKKDDTTITPKLMKTILEAEEEERAGNLEEQTFDEHIKWAKNL